MSNDVRTRLWSRRGRGKTECRRRSSSRGGASMIVVHLPISRRTVHVHVSANEHHIKYKYKYNILNANIYRRLKTFFIMLLALREALRAQRHPEPQHRRKQKL